MQSQISYFVAYNEFAKKYQITGNGHSWEKIVKVRLELRNTIDIDDALSDIMI